jgi:hypothetical protein
MVSANHGGWHSGLAGGVLLTVALVASGVRSQVFKALHVLQLRAQLIVVPDSSQAAQSLFEHSGAEKKIQKELFHCERLSNILRFTLTGVDE